MDYTDEESSFNHIKNELESLGVRTYRLDGSKDLYEMEDLVDNLKQQFVRDYKSTRIFTD